MLMNRNELRHKMCSTFIHMKRAFVNELREVGISYQQWNTLKTIKASSDPISAKQLVEELDSDKATISGIVRRLVSAGYLFEKTNPRDKRENLLFLSNKSDFLCESIITIESKFNEEIFDDFSTQDVDVLSSLLDKLNI